MSSRVYHVMMCAYAAALLAIAGLSIAGIEVERLVEAYVLAGVLMAFVMWRARPGRGDRS